MNLQIFLKQNLKKKFVTSEAKKKLRKFHFYIKTKKEVLMRKNKKKPTEILKLIYKIFFAKLEKICHF